MFSNLRKNNQYCLSLCLCKKTEVVRNAPFSTARLNRPPLYSTSLKFLEKDILFTGLRHLCMQKSIHLWELLLCTCKKSLSTDRC